MNSKLDNYFSGKLRDHQVTPSPQAWEKVESRLSKKNSTVVALRIAAAVALVGMVTVMLVDRDPARVDETQSAQQQTVPVSPDSINNTSITTSPAVVAPETRALNKTAPQRTSTPEIKSEDEATPEHPTLVLETTALEQIETVAPQVSNTKKRIVIVYTLPTINKSEAPPAVAVAEEEKKTGLQKVMDVAMDVRATENPLGELREAKDDLFAREFRKSKNKEN